MNNEKLERFSKLKQELESMAKSIFESMNRTGFIGDFFI